MSVSVSIPYPPSELFSSMTTTKNVPMPLIEPNPNKTYIKTHDDILRDELLLFYENKEYLRRMSGIINGKRLSLRLLDWFVCNFSKEYYTMYEIQRGEKTIRFKVYPDYKTNLDIYSKKRFAPFCRHERMYISYDDENMMETTLGQLNFFRWVFKNYLLEYMEANYDEIKKDMDTRNTSRKRRTSSDKSSSSVDSAISSSCESGAVESLSSESIPVPISTAISSIDKPLSVAIHSTGKTRKKREELSSSACRSLRFERNIPVTFKFGG